MKPAPFDYTRPRTVADAARLLATTPDAKILAGGQTLGPMLNLRLAQPALLIDITRIAELAAVREDEQSVTIGATVTHAAIEDGRVPDPTGGFLPRVARDIAYRAVRTRGTIGGSLAHADPAADWLSCLTALEAEMLIAGADGERRAPLSGFMRGAMETELRHDEIVVGIRIPRRSRHARFGYHKICRKTGEFAEAIGVAVSDPDRQILRLVASTAAGAPIAMDGGSLGLGGTRPPDQATLRQALQAAGASGDAYDLTLHATALQRAITRMQAA
ncbi:MAG: carbon monoxide dehydrogenase [Hyphomicrobiaceae bacterium]|nr:MAG: carbon monoxide dehydrogenase [Hyphomicrobiaceae bacterium]